MAKVGRPSTYTQELADTICEQLACGDSMRTVCKAENMPAMSTVFKWLRENKEFSEQYARAKEEATDAIVEELLDIADDGANDWMIRHGKDGHESWQLNGEHIQRSRVRIDTRKWLVGKLKPKKYGDKLDLSSSDGTMTPTVIIESSYATKPKFRIDNSAPEADELAADSSSESS